MLRLLRIIERYEPCDVIAPKSCLSSVSRSRHKVRVSAMNSVLAIRLVERHITNKNTSQRRTQSVIDNKEQPAASTSTGRSQCPDSKKAAAIKQPFFLLSNKTPSTATFFFQSLEYPHHEDFLSSSDLVGGRSLLLFHAFHSRSLESQSILEFPPILPSAIGVEF